MDLVAGVDEVGRGPLAGPVVAAAVILPDPNPIQGLADSKKLSAKRRECLNDEIYTQAISVNIGVASVEEIDAFNILEATMLAMKRAVSALAVQPTHVLVDGNRCPSWRYASTAVVKGDAKYPCISAASIVAKVARDRLMHSLAEKYPGYGFDKNAGYPTPAHLEALRTLGASPVHRKSFAPVKAVLSQGVLF
ncbi:MAG: ribonuclease HII [Gammaproteobacteria bacterium]|nr:MAG: ribonuclease HII [Gammaproteobacteria bacterium]